MKIKVNLIVKFEILKVILAINLMAMIHKYYSRNSTVQKIMFWHIFNFKSLIGK